MEEGRDPGRGAKKIKRKTLNSLNAGELQASLFQILHYRYYNYDLDQPFMPQYTSNMAALERLLQQRLGEVKEL